MKRLYRLCFAALATLLILSTAGNVYKRTHYITRDFSELSLDNENRIMIVAHPDDEAIFGGAHLLQGGWLIVVITAGNDIERAEELLSFVQKTGNKAIMLGYPDKTFGERNNWDNCRAEILQNIEELLSKKDWEMIVTHNKKGEYGHIHHKMIHCIVTKACQKFEGATDNLYFFAKYYTKKNIAKNKSSKISKEELRTKTNLLYSCYPSQRKVIRSLSHMLKFETFQKYDEVNE